MTGSGGGVIDSRDLVQSPSTTLLQAQVAPHNAGAAGSASRTAASDGLSGVGVVLSVRKPSTSGGIGEGTGSYALYGSALNGLSAVRRGCTDQPAAEMTEFAEEEIPRLYISVTDLSKFYLYLALGRNAQALTYFSDPRYESTWRGAGTPPPEWAALHHERGTRRKEIMFTHQRIGFEKIKSNIFARQPRESLRRNNAV